jgi:chromosome segregation ATPase
MEMDPQLLAQRKKLQMEIMLKDSDMKKNERELMNNEIALRDIKHKQTQLQSEFMLKENQLKKLNADHIQLQAELIKLKHQMNNLGR